MMNEKLLVVSAHVGDFVWRSGGTIAKYVKLGAQVDVVVLTYGARGESGAFYKKTGGTLEECKALRKAEGEKAAQVLGGHSVTFCGYDDFPLEMDRERVRALAGIIRDLRPDLILTHDDGPDRVNPDHTKTAQAVQQALAVAENGRFDDGSEPVSRPIPVFGFEPMTPEICEFTPDIYIDVTEEWEKKEAAMACLETQSGSVDAYVQKAILRASFVSGRGGRKECKYAESFSMYAPVCTRNAFVW